MKFGRCYSVLAGQRVGMSESVRDHFVATIAEALRDPYAHLANVLPVRKVLSRPSRAAPGPRNKRKAGK